MNQIIFYAKKAFKFYQRWSKKQKAQQQQQQQHSQGQQQQYQGGQQQPWQNNQQGSPYPPAHGQQQQQHQQPYHQQPYQQPHGGYGAHDGPPTNQDMANASNADYVALRNNAIREGDLMGKAFTASKQAYNAGDGGRAHDLSMEGKEHQRKRDQYNDQAANWIYTENNKVQPRGTIDLHGLYVQESIEYTERAIQSARQSGMTELRVIVGRGNHSPSHVAKIKPAIIDLMQREKLTAQLDPHNPGVLIVDLDGRAGHGSREIIGELERDQNNDCVIM